jgi:hypothetical protein
VQRRAERRQVGARRVAPPRRELLALAAAAGEATSSATARRTARRCVADDAIFGRREISGKFGFFRRSWSTVMRRNGGCMGGLYSGKIELGAMNLAAF